MCSGAGRSFTIALTVNFVVAAHSRQYVQWCRSLFHHSTHGTYHYNYLPGFRLQRWVGGLVCFFLHTSSSCNCPRKPFAVTRRSRRALQRRVCRTPGRALCSRSRLHLAQASCRHRIFLFGFVFPVVTQKVRRALAQPVALSATLCIFAHAPLLPTNFHICCPPAGLGVRLFTGSGAGLRRPLMCCLVYLLTGLSPLQLCLPCHLLFM